MTGDEPSGKTKRMLRQRGRQMLPAVTLGTAGINAGAEAAIRKLLRRDGLVKVRIPPATGKQRKLHARRLADRTQSICVDLVGRSALLWRPDSQALADQQAAAAPHDAGEGTLSVSPQGATINVEDHDPHWKEAR
jgi:RNA-binding protein YhbY